MKRLQRIDKDLSGEAREALAAYVPDGDLARFARELPRALREDFIGTMKRLRDGEFQEALLRLPRRDRTFVRATEYEDTVSSVPMLRDSDGKAYKPEDYLAAFSRFVRRTRTRSPPSGSCWTAPATGAPRRSASSSRSWPPPASASPSRTSRRPTRCATGRPSWTSSPW